MPVPLPTFGPPNYIREHGKHAFMDLSDYNEQKPLKLYRSDKDKEKLKRGIMFYGTDPRGIKPYIKNNTYFEWTLSEKDKNSLFDLTDIKNKETIDNILNDETLNKIKNAFFKTSQNIEAQKIDNNNEKSVVFNFKIELAELKEEKEKYNKEGGILYVRKSDELKYDMEFVKIMKRLLPGYKGTYTKCLQPLFGDSLSHAEVIIWDEELNERLFKNGNMKKINSTSSSRSGSPRSPKRSRSSGSFGSPRSPRTPL